MSCHVPKEKDGGYLPVGVCSKNDKGACISEFNIFVEFQLRLLMIKSVKYLLTLSCSCFELLNEHSSKRITIVIAKKNTERS